MMHSSSEFEQRTDFYADPFSIQILLMGILLVIGIVCKGFDLVWFPWLRRNFPEDSTICRECHCKDRETKIG